jgi:hypothetical protein
LLDRRAQRLPERIAGLVRQAQAGRDGPGEQFRVAQCRQLDQPDSIGERPSQAGGQMQGQAGLPDPAHTA